MLAMSRFDTAASSLGVWKEIRQNCWLQEAHETGEEKMIIESSPQHTCTDGDPRLSPDIWEASEPAIALSLRTNNTQLILFVLVSEQARDAWPPPAPVQLDFALSLQVGIRSDWFPSTHCRHMKASGSMIKGSSCRSTDGIEGWCRILRWFNFKNLLVVAVVFPSNKDNRLVF